MRLYYTYSMNHNTTPFGPMRPGGFTLTKYNAQFTNLGKGSKVLDIGCGTGDTLQFLSERFGCEVFGIDYSEQACVSAGKRVPNAVIKTADAARLPFEDAFFDVALMECTLCLFDDPAGALDEACRVLRSDGCLAISTLTRTSAREDGDRLLLQHAVNLPRLRKEMKKRGFSLLSETDETSHLVQFTADVIFKYGSVKNYVAEMQKQTGACIFPCDISPKGLHYHNLLFQKTAESEPAF